MKIYRMRTKRARPVLASTILLFASPLAAQEPAPLGAPEAPERECVCAWQGEAPRVLRSMMRFNRARLGVELGEPARVDGQTGIRLRGVQEGGPAARAGLRTGDVLLSLDGADLGDEPVDRLLDLLGSVEPGDTVTVAYDRDGRRQTARVVTDHASALSVFGPGDRVALRSFPRPGEVTRRMALAPAAASFFRVDGLQMVEVNEQLGSYFGATEGVLVTDVDAGSTLGLRPGDVILAIGGRAVQDPAHARSILASYRPDEAISLEIMRERRRTTVTGSR